MTKLPLFMRVVATTNAQGGGGGDIVFVEIVELK